ncbi:MAG: gliding motility-associated protein GldE [Niabella sp.]
MGTSQYLLYCSHWFLQASLPDDIQNTTILIVGLCLLIFLSFSVAGAQAAIFSLQEKDIDVLKTKQKPAARRIINLLDEPKEVFTSMLIAKTFLNICIIVLANYLINLYVPADFVNSTLSLVLKFAIIAFILLFLVEIFPRVWVSQNSMRFALEWPFLIYIVEIQHLLLRRVSIAAVAIAGGIGRGMGAYRAEENSIIELDEAIDVQTDEVASPEEKNIMKGIVKFGKISVKKVMRSRLYVSGIEYSMPYEEVIRKVEELHYSRLPVYRESLDDVAGILNTKDLIPHLEETAPDFDWRKKIRPPYFVPESKLIEDLLIDFQKKRIHFAVVVDEFGGTSGIVTMEDIIEEVIGDIKDEFDEEEIVSQKIDDNNYIFEGRTMLHDMCKAMKIPLDTFNAVRGESESVGGLINELSGELPKQGDVFTTGDFELSVLEVERNRVKTAKVTIVPKG